MKKKTKTRKKITPIPDKLEFSKYQGITGFGSEIEKTINQLIDVVSRHEETLLLMLEISRKQALINDNIKLATGVYIEDEEGNVVVKE